MNWIEVYKLNECLQVFSLLVAFMILAVFGHRKTWISTDSIILFLIGFAYAALPKHLIKIQTVEGGSALEDMIARYVGIVLICCGLCVVRSKDSPDSRVAKNTLVSRLFTSSVLLLLQLMSYINIKAIKKTQSTKPPSKQNDKNKVINFEWSEQILQLEMIATFLWMLGNLIHLLRHCHTNQPHPSNTPNQSSQFDLNSSSQSKDVISNSFDQSRDSISRHLYIDSILEVLSAVFLMAFPAKVALIFSPKKTNKVLLHLLRTIASFKLGFGVQSLQATMFQRHYDQRDVFFIRLFNALLGTCYFGLLVYLKQIEWQAFIVMAAVHVPGWLNAVVGGLYPLKQHIKLRTD